MKSLRPHTQSPSWLTNGELSIKIRELPVHPSNLNHKLILGSPSDLEQDSISVLYGFDSKIKVELALFNKLLITQEYK